MQPDWFAPRKSARKSIVHNTRADHYAIRRDNWVLIDAPSGTISGVPDWLAKQNGYTKNPHRGALYDLSSDIGQRSNQFPEQPQLVKQMRQLLARTREQGEVRSK